MKKIITSMMVVVLFVPSMVQAKEPSLPIVEDAIKRLIEVDTKIVRYFDGLDTLRSVDELKTYGEKDLASVTAHVNETGNFYIDNATQFSAVPSTQELWIDLGETLKRISKNLTAMHTTVLASNEKGYNEADAAFAADYQHMAEITDKFATIYESDDPYALWLPIVFAVTLALAIGVFFWSRRSREEGHSEVVRSARKHLFKSSLAPLLGSAITYGWYLLTPPGGTFYALWGLILIGFAYFIRDAFHYLQDPAKLVVAKTEA